MSFRQTIRFSQIDKTLDYVIGSTGKTLRVGTPLGLGKPNLLLNALYDRVEKDPSLNLSIFTALSLAPPTGGDLLSHRFLEPFSRRQWGDAYPILKYSRKAQQGALASNVRVHEFYLQAGSGLGSEILQRDYQSLNYTHVAERVVDEGINIIFQMIAPNPRSDIERYSLSCNADLTLDLVDRCRARGKPVLVVGVVHPGLPFLTGEAEVEGDFFDVILDETENPAAPLFALPRPAVDETDHAIGFFASQLVVDDGTIQIGIGSLSDALVAALVLREERNKTYRELMTQAWNNAPVPPSLNLSSSRFSVGLYGLSEMVMDGFMHLRKAGILRRTVKDVDSGIPTYLHGAFFLGSKSLYAWLNSLKGEDFEGLRMGRISKVNHLYGRHLTQFREQRKNPRFFNTCMQVTLLGGAASETLENGRVVSGVGGQYNFVAMSHELVNSRSVLMLRSTRQSKGKRSSNIVWSHGHLTIPRHLRDIVVTEYGIADLRGRTDEEVICALLKIADSQFQSTLLAEAKKNGKVRRDYLLPEWAKGNTPERVCRWIGQGRSQGVFPTFPWGSDFTPEEENLVQALEHLKKISNSRYPRLKLSGCFLNSFFGAASHSKKRAKELERMRLDRPQNWKERIYRRLLLSVLK